MESMFDFYMKIKTAWMARRNHSEGISLFFRLGWKLMMGKLTSISLLIHM